MNGIPVDKFFVKNFVSDFLMMDWFVKTTFGPGCYELGDDWDVKLWLVVSYDGSDL